MAEILERAPLASDRARRYMRREFGWRVESVSPIRAQHEGEFATIVIWAPDVTASVVGLLTDGSHIISRILELTRIHAGVYANRLYVRFADRGPGRLDELLHLREYDHDTASAIERARMKAALVAHMNEAHSGHRREQPVTGHVGLGNLQAAHSLAHLLLERAR